MPTTIQAQSYPCISSRNKLSPFLTNLFAKGYQPSAPTQKDFAGIHPSRKQHFFDTQNGRPMDQYQHLIIGDSLTRDIYIPDCFTITKGGCGIKDIINMLYNDMHITEADYKIVKSVTLCVGTNPLSNPNYPQLGIMHDYDQLVRKLSDIFPNAIIGLFNITPRKYNSFNNLTRIKSFNNFLFDLEFTYKNAKVITKRFLGIY